MIGLAGCKVWSCCAPKLADDAPFGNGELSFGERGERIDGERKESMDSGVVVLCGDPNAACSKGDEARPPINSRGEGLPFMMRSDMSSVVSSAPLAAEPASVGEEFRVFSSASSSGLEPPRLAL